MGILLGTIISNHNNFIMIGRNNHNNFIRNFHKHFLSRPLSSPTEFNFDLTLLSATPELAKQVG